MSDESTSSHCDNENDEHESSSSSSSEDEDAHQWTDGMEKNFLAALSSLKCKDPKIYNETTRFFNETNQSRAESPSSSRVSTAPVTAPLYLRDYERHVIIDKKGILEDESDNDDYSKDMLQHRPSDSHVEEENRLRENLTRLFHNDDKDVDEEAQDTLNAGFLKLKNKSHNEKLKEEEDYVQWLKGTKSQLNDQEMEHQLKYLRDFWNDPTLNDDERFLRDYVLNKKYNYENQMSHSLERSPSPVQFELPFAEEEEILEKCEEYEEKYNFRFEEPDRNFVKTYPRVIETSLRRKDETRKQKREARKLKKEHKLELKRLEVKRAKKEKKQELLERIEKLKRISGNSQLGFDFADLNDDFDADEYDKKMRKLFDEEFYNGQDDNIKPQFSNSDLDDEYDENVEQAELNIDDAGDTSMVRLQDTRACDELEEDKRATKKESRSSRRKGHKKSKFAELTGDRQIPLFDPSEKTYQQYLDEYYNLDFEDVVGDTPCRFKYRKVTPNSFGLSIDEILAADDTELNKWCSMRKIDTIRPEQSEKFDLKIYSKKGADPNLKRKYLPSLFKDENEDKDKTELVSRQDRIENDGSSSHRVSKKPRKRKKNIRSDINLTNTNEKTEIDIRNERNDRGSRKRRSAKESISSENNMNKKRKPNRHEKRNEANESANFISDNRLRAYNINPKKFKNRIKYGPKNDKSGGQKKSVHLLGKKRGKN